MFRNTKVGISNLIKWAPIIWRDRDWGHAFFWEVLKFKLERMEKFFRSEKAVSRNGVRDADEMKKCLMVLKRITENPYGDIAFKWHDKKWGSLKMSFGPGGRVNLYRDKVRPEDEGKEREEFRKCVKHEQYLRDQDMTYLFSLMSKHLQSWWD